MSISVKEVSMYLSGATSIDDQTAEVTIKQGRIKSVKAVIKNVNYKLAKTKWEIVENDDNAIQISPGSNYGAYCTIKGLQPGEATVRITQMDPEHLISDDTDDLVLHPIIKPITLKVTIE